MARTGCTATTCSARPAPATRRCWCAGTAAGGPMGTAITSPSWPRMWWAWAACWWHRLTAWWLRHPCRRRLTTACRCWPTWCSTLHSGAARRTGCCCRAILQARIWRRWWPCARLTAGVPTCPARRCAAVCPSAASWTCTTPRLRPAAWKNASTQWCWMTRCRMP